ncbi:7969_t:CDS:1, partial [Ambispora leptoticha]
TERSPSIKGKKQMNDTYISEETIASVREFSNQTLQVDNHEQVAAESFETTTVMHQI